MREEEGGTFQNFDGKFSIPPPSHSHDFLLSLENLGSSHSLNNGFGLHLLYRFSLPRLVFIGLINEDISAILI